MENMLNECIKKIRIIETGKDDKELKEMKIRSEIQEYARHYADDCMNNIIEIIQKVFVHYPM